MTDEDASGRGGFGRALGRLAVRACPFVWVAKARGRWRFVLVAVECLVAAVFGAWLWRTVSLRDLPLVGEPFPYPAVLPGPEVIPPPTNAQVLYARALAVYVPIKSSPRANGVSLTYRVPQPRDPAVRAWVEANREALELFYRASDLADSAPSPLPTTATPRRPGPSAGVFQLRELAWLAIEEASAAEAAGDLDAAWRAYKAVLRTSRLVARRGDIGERQVAWMLRSFALGRLPRWASLPENTPERLRRALDDALALEAIAPDDAYTLETSYAAARFQLERPDGPFAQGRDDGFYTFKGVQIAGEYGRAALRFDRYINREPERSRRVVRLAFANWLGWASLPPAQRPKPAAGVVLRLGNMSQRVDFFAFPPGAAVPPDARAVDPRVLARGFADAREASTLTSWTWGLLVADVRRARRDQAAIVTTLAEALYQRERGTPPPTPESLVGPYLKALPDDSTSDADDDTIPVIEVGHAP